MGPDSSPDRRSFSLRGRPDAITLDERGIHHPRTPRGGGFAYTPYEEVTHLATTQRALWLGSWRSVYVLHRKAFVDPDAPEHLVRELLTRIAGQPGGSAQLARMAQIEETSRTPGPLRATWGLTIVCLLVFGAQLLVGRSVHDVGYFNRWLVEDGDVWRVVTANLLHAKPEIPIHLTLNLLGLLALGAITERSLGGARTVCVMVASGAAAMLASGAAGYAEVVGVSGVVFGLLGAVCWLEMRCARELPAWWRVPRRGLVTMLVVSMVFGVLIPMIAGAAHVGGFVGGLAATAALAGRPVGRRPSPGWVRGLAVASLALCLVAVGAATLELSRPHDYTARLVARIASLPKATATELNNRAWFIAIDPDSSPELLEAALLLAERAVRETGRDDPNLLDTLAEIQFLLGQDEQAVATIDEAIAKARGEPYYYEQRRRFTGERDPSDRPDAPLPWDTPSEPRRVVPDDGVTV